MSILKMHWNGGSGGNCHSKLGDRQSDVRIYRDVADAQRADIRIPLRRRARRPLKNHCTRAPERAGTP